MTKVYCAVAYSVQVCCGRTAVCTWCKICISYWKRNRYTLAICIHAKEAHLVQQRSGPGYIKLEQVKFIRPKTLSLKLFQVYFPDAHTYCVLWLVEYVIHTD